MRWDNLTVEAEGAEQAHLPGYRDPAVVRRFDVPEAMDIRCYEVRAKSVLNRVPERSRMPFRYTINPYRGCSHACRYCVSAETPVLLATGRHRRIADLRAGDAIYGTFEVGRYRRLVVTRVLDHWSTIKPAYRVVLEDGTELITSGDHRFLTQRGWKHVTDSEGWPQRAHLTSSSELLGTGRFAEQPVPCADYRAGYLCGIVRGDGHVGSYMFPRAERQGRADRFRLAPIDFEALQRAKRYLDVARVDCWERVFTEAAGSHGETRSIATSARASVDFIRWLIEWPEDASDDWCKGFLAGIFDAEGSCSRHVLRIANTDPEILRWTERCMRRFGFDVALEDRGLPNGMKTIRLRGGQVERMRFFHLTDPAITRKRSFVGQAIENDARLRVVSIEPLRTAMRLYDITTGTGDFIANGVVSHNCFARPTHTYLDFNAGRDFEREIVVKVNAPEVVRAELNKPSWKHEHVAMGTNTDPYQWVEGRYELMTGIWEALRDAANPCSILTKSPLLLRDLPLMLQIAEVTDISASLSVPTLDEKAWRATEPHTPHPRARLEAVAELNRAGIPTGVLVAPLMPGINDAPEQLEPLLQMAHDAGAVGVGGIALHLRGEVKGLWFDWLRDHRPDLVEHYEKLYARGAYAPPEERRRLAALVSGHTDAGRPRRMAQLRPPGDRDGPAAASAPPPRRPVQESLF